LVGSDINCYLVKKLAILPRCDNILFEIKTQKVGQELTKQAKKSKLWFSNSIPNKNITIDTGTQATPQQKEIAAHFLTNFFALC